MKIEHKLKSMQAQSYFGKSIAIGDFKGNGQREMFIGAPGYTNVEGYT